MDDAVINKMYKALGFLADHEGQEFALQEIPALAQNQASDRQVIAQLLGRDLISANIPNSDNWETDLNSPITGIAITQAGIELVNMMRFTRFPD